MKKGFTIVEVSILLVIFLIVAFLVAPLSLDDTRQARNTSKWRSVQEDFTNIFFAIETLQNDNGLNFKTAISKVLENETKSCIPSYKITYLNGAQPDKKYKFENFRATYANSVVSLNIFEETKNDIIGTIMYDVNGVKGPNTWGKDVYGFNIYNNKLEPLGKDQPLSAQKQDCSRTGTGLSCSNYYIIGGNFD